MRTVEKYKPPYQLNRFPKNIPIDLAKEVVYLLATRNTPILEGSDWEQIFARLIGGRWKPTNVGLDDVLLEQTAWSAKTIKSATPSKAKKVRLISGRNSPTFSFGQDQILSQQPEFIAEMVLKIWNERVSSIRAHYNHLRTIVLLKSDDLLELAMFEYDTVMYDYTQFKWLWNKNGNLEGYCSITNSKKFTWQPHGSQFTITENVPDDRLAIRLRQPEFLEKNIVLDGLGFNDSWVTVLNKRSQL